MAKRIGVLTAGGDAPGLNVCLKAIAHSAIDRGWEVVGLRKGWEGLLYFDPDDPDTHASNAMLITKSRIRDVDRLPGSFLHSSRLNPDSVIPEALPSCLEHLTCGSDPVDTTEHIKRAVAGVGLDVLVVLGDNAALNYAARLSGENVPLIGVPKTVHNDVSGSDYSIGFSTALGRGVQFVHEVRAMAGSREEIAVVEVLGRSTGLATLLTALLSGSDRSLIPEVPFDAEVLASGLLEDKRANPNNYAILTMSEVARATAEQTKKYREQIPGLPETATPGISGVGAVVTELLELLTGQRMIFQPLSLLVRTAVPDGQDLLGAVNLALLVINLIEAGRFGRLAAYRQLENYVDLPIETVLQPGGNIDVAEHYDADALRPKPSIMWASRI